MPPYLRCPKCFATPFAAREPVSSGAVATLTCAACGTEFASFRGVPYLGSFDHTDAHTVAEMLAIRQRLKRLHDDSERVEPEMVFKPLLERWAGKAPDKDLSYLKTRQMELILAQALLQGVPLDGALTLDVGAGYGIDSAYYESLGARMVALEPGIGILAEASLTFRRFTWVGGTADALPIATESMDVVTANASLHHHLKPLASLDEMLRVLKPGGWMITVCDSVKGSREAPLEEDLIHWDNHPTVLGGINEQILRLDVLLEKLMSYGEGIAGEVYMREGAGVFSRFTLAGAAEEVKRRPRLWAVIGMRVQKLRSLPSPEHRLREGRISTPLLTRTMLEDADDTAGYRLLSTLLGKEEIRKTTPLAEADRFLQLSGWRWPLPSAPGKDGPEWRMVCKRGRLFMQPEAATQSVNATFAVPAVDARQAATVSLRINGRILHQVEVPRGQIQHWGCALPEDLPRDVPCCLVLELDSAPESEWAEHVPATSQMAVQRLELGNEPPQGCRAQGLLPRASLTALRAESALPAEVIVAVGSLVEPALNALGFLRQLGVQVKIVCDDVLWPFYGAQYGGARATGAAPFATGMSHDDARGKGSAWFLHEGWALDLRAPDPFAAQLAPPVPEAETKLRNELDKTRHKLEEARTKLAKARTKLEARPRRGFWSRIFGK